MVCSLLQVVIVHCTAYSESFFNPSHNKIVAVVVHTITGIRRQELDLKQFVNLLTFVSNFIEGGSNGYLSGNVIVISNTPPS